MRLPMHIADLGVPLAWSLAWRKCAAVRWSAWAWVSIRWVMVYPFSLTRARRASAAVVEMAFLAGSKSSTGSMMTADLVAGSATTYCQVQVTGSKQVWTMGSEDMM